ncbi:armadillo repeat-containing protein 8-like isoform X1 [Helicoverpa zea]|uniref:armadillo repeat-containing protein 8-like isoform X1 n=1 Tax=Helicoverpa zea TaxID=7113 RepID=UPI001F5906BC|nr:armadillo repeat-containing protein 8-like isoform X1 [Helicoverpa zea]
MQQITVFMDIESSRSYIDELYSSDAPKVVEALVALKNSVIGSNRQKSSVIQQGVVPRLLQLMSDETLDPNIRLEATITIGSLAKGTTENVNSLVEQGTATALVELLKTAPVGTKLAEAGLCALRSVFMTPPAPISALPADMRLLTRLTQIAREGSPTARACVVRILSIWCGGAGEQEALCAAGACEAAAALLAATPPAAPALPALDLLAAMCFENTNVSHIALNTRHGDKTIPELLSTLVCRDKPLPVAMGAARCLTFMHRANALPADDARVVFGALPCLARLCTKDMPEDIRASAAETLAYLAEVDTSLQRLAAISNHLMTSLAEIVNCQSPAAKQGAFKCFASLGANDEDIRKRIIETHGLMVHVVNGMNNPEASVRLAAVRCLHSLSRSVQQLRTTFQDHAVWKPLMQLLTDSPGTELLTVGSSTLCNLLLEFSPAKEPMLDQGAVEMLCNLTKRPEAALRLNGIWALMNMAFQAEQKVKQRILSCLGTEQMFRLLGDADTRVIMKTLGLLRNLLSTRHHIDAIMTDYSEQVMQAVIVVLEGSYPAEVKEQALCILGNIGDGEKAKDLIMANEDVLRKLVDYLVQASNRSWGQTSTEYVTRAIQWAIEKTTEGAPGEQAAGGGAVRVRQPGVARRGGRGGAAGAPGRARRAARAQAAARKARRRASARQVSIHSSPATWCGAARRARGRARRAARAQAAARKARRRASARQVSIHSSPATWCGAARRARGRARRAARAQAAARKARRRASARQVSIHSSPATWCGAARRARGRARRAARAQAAARKARRRASARQVSIHSSPATWCGAARRARGRARRAARAQAAARKARRRASARQVSIHSSPATWCGAARRARGRARRAARAQAAARKARRRASARQSEDGSGAV